MSCIRSMIRSKLTSVLGHEKKAKNIEISIYKWSINHLNTHENFITASFEDRKPIWENKFFKSAYLGKTRSMLFNITNTDNPRFKENILSGNVSTRTITELQPHEVFPELYTTIFEKNRIKQIKNDEEKVKRINKNGVECLKCKSKNTTHYELQTRSADEPMTVYYTCCDCEHRWKDDGKA